MTTRPYRLPDPASRLPIPVPRWCLCTRRADPTTGCCARCGDMPRTARWAFWREGGWLPQRYPVDWGAVAGRLCGEGR